MNITCESCGGKNTLPKGKTEMFCSFCGGHIEVVQKPILATKTTTITKGPDKDKILAYLRGGSKGKLDLPMANLKGIHLKGANLAGANLSGANLKNSDLVDSNLQNTNLKDANLKDANFCGVNLNGAIISGAVFTSESHGEEFANANLTNVIAQNSTIKYDFRSVKSLKGADFSGCYLKGCCFDKIDLEDSIFKGAFISGVSIGGANLKSADFSSVISGNEAEIGGKNINKERICFIGSNLTNANLTESQLINALLYKSDLTGADLSGSDLRGAEFVNIYLNNTDNRLYYLDHAVLKNTNLSNW